MSVMVRKSVAAVFSDLKQKSSAVVYHGDCLNLLRSIPDDSVELTLTSPPYCMGKEYEVSESVDDFISAHEVILPEIARITRPGGSICWQVGYHVDNQSVYPLDYTVFKILGSVQGITLRNRIVWAFGHGLHSRRRLSGRHETILWFTKGDDFYFDLDSVRVPQKYPGKRHYKGKHKGEFSGNPKGKNPGDIWEIPNVNANHLEKVDHPCQFPVGLAERCVRAFSPTGGLVFDPFMGSSSTGVAAIANGRRFLGAEIDSKYVALARERLAAACAGTAAYRSADQPIHSPKGTEAVARRPEHFEEVFLG